MSEFVFPRNRHNCVSFVHYLQPAQVYTSAVYRSSVVELNMPFELYRFVGVFLTLCVFKYNTLRFRASSVPVFRLAPSTVTT